MPGENQDQNGQQDQQQDPQNAGGQSGDGGQQGGAENQHVRPEGLPDDYWSDDAGVDFEKLLGRHNELTAIAAERDSHLAQVPDEPDGYELKLPEDFEQPDPDNPIEVNPDDPMVQVAREFAKANNFTQAQFESLVTLEVQRQQVENELLENRLGEEKEALGSKAQQRIDAVTSWLGAKLGTEHANALIGTMFTKVQVEGFEKLIELAKGSGPKLPGSGDRQNGQTEISDEDYEKMTPEQKILYARQQTEKRQQASR